METPIALSMRFPASHHEQIMHARMHKKMQRRRMARRTSRRSWRVMVMRLQPETRWEIGGEEEGKTIHQFGVEEILI